MGRRCARSTTILGSSDDRLGTSLPSCQGRCYSIVSRLLASRPSRFRFPTAPEDRCYDVEVGHNLVRPRVSIPNGPRGPLLRRSAGRGLLVVDHVSIPNGPRGPLLQRGPDASRRSRASFDSQRLRRAVITLDAPNDPSPRRGFDSQRPPRAVATDVDRVERHRHFAATARSKSRLAEGFPRPRLFRSLRPRGERRRLRRGEP